MNKNMKLNDVSKDILISLVVVTCVLAVAIIAVPS
jgi:cell division protein FtsL